MPVVSGGVCIPCGLRGGRVVGMRLFGLLVVVAVYYGVLNAYVAEGGLMFAACLPTLAHFDYEFCPTDDVMTIEYVVV